MFISFKAQIKCILLITAVNVVISCLVTNCPRGGKRGKPDTYFRTTNSIHFEHKKCKICILDEALCSSNSCLSENMCQENGHCVSREVCCSNSKVLQVRQDVQIAACTKTKET